MCGWLMDNVWIKCGYDIHTLSIYYPYPHRSAAPAFDWNAHRKSPALQNRWWSGVKYANLSQTIMRWAPAPQIHFCISALLHMRCEKHKKWGIRGRSAASLGRARDPCYGHGHYLSRNDVTVLGQMVWKSPYAPLGWHSFLQ